MTGQVCKAHSSNFFVKSGDEVYKLCARGILKRKGDNILIGDYVEFSQGVITKVLDRKNFFVRPSVANIDSVIVVISPEPKPDFLLIDKLLINAFNQNIDVFFAINKSDLDDGLYDSVVKEYRACDIKFLKISAKDRSGTDDLKSLLKGRLNLLAGQSAVGKTSLVNALFGLELKTGELSEKILRGRHTTTYSEIHEYDGVRIIDSPGFAVIEAEIAADGLPSLYPEFCAYSENCRFRSCTHINEPDCKVKEAVSSGLISESRYGRYLEIYSESTKRRNKNERN